MIDWQADCQYMSNIPFGYQIFIKKGLRCGIASGSIFIYKNGWQLFSRSTAIMLGAPENETKQVNQEEKYSGLGVMHRIYSYSIYIQLALRFKHNIRILSTYLNYFLLKRYKLALYNQTVNIRGFYASSFQWWLILQVFWSHQVPILRKRPSGQYRIHQDI